MTDTPAASQPKQARLFILVGITAFLLFVVALMPLSVLIAGLDDRFGATAVGSPSDATISGRFLGPDYGRQVIKLKSGPFDLIDLAFDGAFTLSGQGMAGAGKLHKGIWGAIGLQDTQLSFSAGLLSLPFSLAGAVDVTINRAELTPEGQCISLDGTVTTDAFEKSRETLVGWMGPRLTGTLGCDEGQITLLASGSRGSDQITIQGAIPGIGPRIGAGVGNTLEIRILSDNPALRAGLKQVGFKEIDERTLVSRLGE